MRLIKDDKYIELTREAHIAAFVQAGWVEAPKEEAKTAKKPAKKNTKN